VKYYSYYPGCSDSDGGGKSYGSSSEAVAKALEVELHELEDWNCCGSTPYTGVNELGSYSVAARNLALAEKRGLDLVTPCSSCYIILDRTNRHLKEHPKLKSQVDEALAAGGQKYNGTVKVRHILDVFANDVGYDAIKAKVKKDLAGLKVAPYYGCQVVRPGPGFDNPDNPQTLERVIQSLGAEATPFPLRTRCCGASLIVSEEDLAIELIHKLLENAASNGAQCIVTVCPMCQTNLDVYQSRVNRKYKTKFNLPVLFFTQLIGVAFGTEKKALGLGSGIVPADKVLAKYTGK
jgi:heterodisulfide reductase subunit B2